MKLILFKLNDNDLNQIENKGIKSINMIEMK